LGGTHTFLQALLWFTCVEAELLFISQLAYGVFEGIYIYIMPFSEYLKWANIISTAGFCVGLIPSIYLIIKRLLGEI